MPENIVPRADLHQIRLAKNLGLSVMDGMLEAMVRAMVLDHISEAFGPIDRARHSEPTEVQHKVASQLGVDISEDSYRLAFARIGDRLLEVNVEAVRRLDLQPGDRVLLSRELSYVPTDATDEDLICEVASITPNGRVQFRHEPGKPRNAPASMLEKLYS